MCSIPSAVIASEKPPVPADKFDLSQWNITLPDDADKDGKPDSVMVKKLKKYSHPDFFYLDNQNRIVFTAPNKAVTTENSSNTRSELRQMLRGTNTRIKTHSSRNNFSVLAHDFSNKFGSVGGRLDATLHVDHVPSRSGIELTKSAHSAVVGQIHAVKYDNTSSGFGYGNEPLKIFYKKFPHHKTGSVFWTYERNLAKDNPSRKDIAYPVWGQLWGNQDDPASAGIALGESFSYTVNVHENTMYLTFITEGHEKVEYSINLVNNVDAYGEVDPLDNLYSYGGDSLYFKAGIYNQCSTKTRDGTWYAG